MRTTILARLVGGVLLLLLSVVAWRSTGDYRSTTILLIAAWSAYGVAVTRFLLTRRRTVKR